MSKKMLSSLIAGLLTATPAFAQTSDDPLRVEGSATAGGIYNRQNGDDKAKLQEYQDLGNGALTNVWARGRNSTNWFEGYGENFGRSDQYMPPFKLVGRWLPHRPADAERILAAFSRTSGQRGASQR